MYSRCPGQDFRNLKVSVHRCQTCGTRVEIFSDEIKIKCPKCGKYVYTGKIPSCIDWCKSARHCVGEDKWQELKRKG